MTTRADIVASARKELGTKWQHQARLPGVAVDCHGFLGVVGKDCGIAEAPAWLADQDLRTYGRHARPTMSLPAARRYLDEVKVSEAAEGDVLFMAPIKHPKFPHHFAIITQAEPLKVIHAFYWAGEVVETGIPAGWFPTHAFRFRGVQ